MKEKKMELGSVTVSVDGKIAQWEFVSILVGTFKGDRRVTVGKTEHGTYVLEVKKPDENGNMVEQGMHLTKESLAALLTSLHLFLEEENERMSKFSEICHDENAGYLYKRVGEDEE